MQSQDQVQQITETEDLFTPLSEEEQSAVQGGWVAVVGLAIAGGALVLQATDIVLNAPPREIAGRGSYAPGGLGVGGSRSARAY